MFHITVALQGESKVNREMNPPPPPQGMKKLAFRAPIALYRAGLGWLLGGRFLLLNHVGRNSGLPRQAVLEVVDHDRETDTYYVASGFGKKSHWYQNILKQPNVTIQVGRRRLAVTAVPLSPQESGQAMVEYAQRNPTAAKALSRILGIDVDGSEESYRAIGREAIPFVAFRPRKALTPAPLLPGWLLPLAAVLLFIWWWRKGERSDGR